MRPTETQYLFTSTSIKTTDGLLIKAMYLKGFVLRFVLPFYCNRKSWKACGNFWEFWVFSRWPNVPVQALHIQKPSCFRCFNIIQTSTLWPALIFLALLKLPDLRPTLMFKVPTSSHAPPPPPLDITLIGAVRRKNLTFFSW